MYPRHPISFTFNFVHPLPHRMWLRFHHLAVGVLLPGLLSSALLISSAPVPRITDEPSCTSFPSMTHRNFFLAQGQFQSSAAPYDLGLYQVASGYCRSHAAHFSQFHLVVKISQGSPASSCQFQHCSIASVDFLGLDHLISTLSHSRKLPLPSATVSEARVSMKLINLHVPLPFPPGAKAATRNAHFLEFLWFRGHGLASSCPHHLMDPAAAPTLLPSGSGTQLRRVPQLRSILLFLYSLS